MQGPRRHLGCEAEPDGLGSSSTPGGRRHPQAPTMPGPGPTGSFQPHPRGAHLMTAGRAGCCAGASRNLSPSPRPYAPYNPPPTPARLPRLGSARPRPSTFSAPLTAELVQKVRNRRGAARNILRCAVGRAMRPPGGAPRLTQPAPMAPDQILRLRRGGAAPPGVRRGGGVAAPRLPPLPGQQREAAGGTAMLGPAGRRGDPCRSQAVTTTSCCG